MYLRFCLGSFFERTEEMGWRAYGAIPSANVTGNSWENSKKCYGKVEQESVGGAIFWQQINKQ